jgi:hypothetical protein
MISPAFCFAFDAAYDFLRALLCSDIVVVAIEILDFDPRFQSECERQREYDQ